MEILLHGEFETLNFYYEINNNKNIKVNASQENLHYNDYSLVNIHPAIKSKYYFVAMVNYLLQNEEYLFDHLKGEDSETLDLLMSGIKEGFDRTYKIDNKDLEFLQMMHKDTVVEASFVKEESRI